VRVVELRLRDELLRDQLLRALVIPPRELDVRALGLDGVLLSAAWAPASAARAACRLASALRRNACSCSLSSWRGRRRP